MFNEFPTLSCLNFFESAIAFMAVYGIKNFLIAQSFNQIDKIYNANNSTLNNYHVRVSFATNDVLIVKRVFDALNTDIEMKAMNNLPAIGSRYLSDN